MSTATEATSSVVQFFRDGGFFTDPARALQRGGAELVIILRILGLRRDLAVPPLLKEEVDRVSSDSGKSDSEVGVFIGRGSFSDGADFKGGVAAYGGIARR